MLSKLAEVRKGLITLVGTTLTVLTFLHTLTFLPASFSVPIGIAFAAATVFLNWLVPNRPAV